MPTWPIITAIIAVTAAAIWFVDRWIVRTAAPAATNEETRATENELRRELRDTGIFVDLSEIAGWSNEEYDAAWAYVRALNWPASGTPWPIPRHLIRRERSTR